MSTTLPPSEGERRAISGYRPQYALAADRILRRLREGRLEWIRLVDPAAGRLDDFQIATPGRLEAFQVKWSRYPSTLTFNSLITGSEGSPALIEQLGDGWTRLRGMHPERRIVVHLVTNDSPSVNDGTIPTDVPAPNPRHFAAFIAQAWEPARKNPFPSVSVPEGWKRTWYEMQRASGLTAGDFDDFCKDCKLEFRVPSSDAQDGDGADAQAFADDLVALMDFLTRVIASPEHPSARAIHLSSMELLAKLGWIDRTEMRSRHEFPPPQFSYQEIESTSRRLWGMVESLPGGYVGLVGPPGSGKSTLGSHLLSASGYRFLRYYAFVPDSPTPQSLRGESVSFLHDLSVQLAEAGFCVGGAMSRMDRVQLLERLHLQLAELGKDWRENSRKTIIFIDGLDHVPREQHPGQTFLADLPDPTEIPEGVIIVLGTQTTELDDLPPSICIQLRARDRRVEMDPMTPIQIREFITATPLDGRLNDEQHNIVSEIAAGHPLMLSMLVDRLSEAPDKAAIDAILSDEEPFAGKIDARYERFWHAAVERTGDADLADLLAKIARIRGAVDLGWVESWAGRGVTYQLRNRLRHLFRRESECRWYFFHNSVRLFLQRKTAEGPEGGFDPERDQLAHAALADCYSNSPPDSAWAWEELYHRAAARNHRRVVDLATPEYFRRQLVGHRPAAVVVEDLRIALRSAATVGNAIGTIRILLAWLEVDARESVLDGVTFSFSEFFESIGNLEHARLFLREGDNLLVGRTRALEAAVAFDVAGHHDEASRLFSLAEPLGVLNGSELVRDDGEVFRLLSAWVVAACRFRPFPQVLGLINGARLRFERRSQEERSNPEEECREVRRKLLVALAETVCENASLASIEMAVESLDANGADAREHFDLRYRTWSVLRDADQHEDACQQVRLIVSRLETGGLDLLSEWQRVKFADMVFRSLKDCDLAKSLICGLPQPNLQTQWSGSRFGPYWYRFRLNLLRFALGSHDRAIDIVPDVENDEYEGAQYFERGVVELARILAHTWRGEPLKAGVLLQECWPLLRLFDRGKDKQRSYDSWNRIAGARGEFYSLLVDIVAASDAEVIPRLADEFDRLWWGRDDLPHWPLTVIADVIITLFKHGMNRGWCEEKLARAEVQLLTGIEDADSRSRAHFDMADYWRRLNATEHACALVKKAVEVGFGIGYRKDLQLNIWCKWADLANTADPSGSIDRFRILIRCILSCVGATEGVAESAAANQLIEMLFRQSPRRAAGLLRPLAEAGAIDYEDGLTQILRGALQSGGAATVPAEVLVRRLLIPISRSVHGGVLTAILRAAPEADVAARLEEAIAVYGAGSDRDAWMGELWKACESFAIPLSKEYTVDHEANAPTRRRDRLNLETGEILSVAEVIERVRCPNDLMELRSAQGALSAFDWNIVFREVCQRLCKENLFRLADLCGDSYADFDLRLRIAQQFIQIGELIYAQELLTEILSAPIAFESELWSESGAKCRAFILLSSIEGVPARNICLQSLAQYFTSSSTHGYLLQQAFDGILIHLAGDQLIEAWNLIAEYLEELSRYSFSEDLPVPEAVAPDTPAEGLFDILVDLLDHPAWILDEIAKGAIAELLLRGGDQQALSGRLLSEDNTKLRASLVVAEAVARDRSDEFRPWQNDLNELSHHRDWGIRALARSLLDRLGLPVPEPPPLRPELIANYRVRALAVPDRIQPLQVAQDRPLPDSIDPSEIIGPFHDEVALLAKASGLHFDRVLRRVREVMDGILPFSAWNAEAEQALRDRMDAAGLRFSFRRPRVRVVERAIRVVFAELTDGGRISGDDIRLVERGLRFWDSGMLLENPRRRPSEIPSMAYPERGQLHNQWIRNGEADIQHAIARRVEEWVVLAEDTTIHFGAEKAPEERRQSLVHGVAYDPDANGRFAGVFPSVIKATRSSYSKEINNIIGSSGISDAVAIVNFHLVYETPGADWIAFEPGLARALDWHPVEEELFAWRDNNGIVVKTIWWCDGHPRFHPWSRDHGETAYGWLVLAQERALELITAIMGPLSRTAQLSRKHQAGGSEEHRYADLIEIVS